MRIVIDRLRSDDAERCMDLAERVGWPRETAKWRLLLELGTGYCTRAENKLTSMVVITAHDEGSFVAMMVVDPAHGGRGLGRELLEHALSAAPKPVMLYATERGRPLYAKLGFVAVDEVISLVGTLPDRHPRRDSDLDLVAADARAFGIRRPRLIEALRQIADAVATRDDGFAIRFHNGAIHVVGPVVAASQEAAIALIEEVGTSGMCRIDVPLSSHRVVEHLRERGFIQRTRAPLMTWPTADLRGERDRYHAIALQAWG
jgi:GNAT superfamily N-acetyltransferase